MSRASAPVPSTAICRTGRACLVCCLTSFLSCCSERKLCTIAPAACVLATWPKARPSSASAPARSSKAARRIIFVASMAAGWCLPALACTFSSATPNTAPTASLLNGKATRLRCCAARQSIAPAMARASMASAASRSAAGAATSSTTPTRRAVAALCGWPLATQSTATRAPARRGKRTVPPKPGKRPSLTSGTPTSVSSAMTRSAALRHISSPPPKARPLMATTVGTGKSSKALKASFECAMLATRSAMGCLNMTPNSVMSAPTMKTFLALVTSTPRTFPLDATAAAIAPVAWRNSSTVRPSNLLMASPWRSKTISTTPSFSARTCSDCPWNMLDPVDAVMSNVNQRGAMRIAPSRRMLSPLR